MTDIQTGPEAGPAPHAPAAGPAAPDDDELLPLAVRQARAALRGPKAERVVAGRVHLPSRLRELWRNRELFVFLVRKEIKVKYKNSALGFLWSMLNPALTLLVYFVLFGYFLKNGIPLFVIYLFSAMLAWNLFQTAVMSGTIAIVSNSGIVKKVAFPREILPLASVGSAFMFFFFQSIVLVAFLVVFRHAPAWSELWLLVPAIAALLLFASAVSVFLAAVNVYFRDTQHLVEVLLVAWFWGVPGVYAFSGHIHDALAKHHILWIYLMDPMTPIVMTFQRVFFNVSHAYSTQPPHALLPVMATYGTHWYVAANLIIIAVSVVLLLVAMVVFGRLEGNFAEEL
ncbi:MAG: ABC transporter permease [Actinomycetota bacterium]|jgi:ABC-2 type transport system permease protein|nr:ABC transporter permease [Actinomycetota bacterium]MDA8279931.1 ABC transporter permease [Actinomycetota bacterium]